MIAVAAVVVVVVNVNVVAAAIAVAVALNNLTRRSPVCNILWAVVEMLVPETDVNAAVVACRFLWQKGKQAYRYVVVNACVG